MSEPSLLAYFGHHKCASTWIHRILSEFGARTGRRHGYLHHASQFDGQLEEYVTHHRLDMISYVNAEIEHVIGLSDCRGFHVVRDPRDLLVSAYFSHRNSHPSHDFPGLMEHREQLLGLPKEEGLLLELEFSSGVLADVGAWDYEQPNVLEVKQEELTAAPYEGFLEIFRFLRVLDERTFDKRARLNHWTRVAWNSVARLFPVKVPRIALRQYPAESLLGLVHENRFTKLSAGRERGKEDALSHYRKGVSGDWRHHFGEDITDAFKGRYNEMLLRLGYEEDPDWNPAS